MVVKGLSARLHRRNYTCIFAPEKNEIDMSKLNDFEKERINIPILAMAMLGMALMIFGIMLLAG